LPISFRTLTYKAVRECVNRQHSSIFLEPFFVVARCMHINPGDIAWQRRGGRYASTSRVAEITLTLDSTNVSECEGASLCPAIAPLMRKIAGPLACATEGQYRKNRPTAESNSAARI